MSQVWKRSWEWGRGNIKEVEVNIRVSIHTSIPMIQIITVTEFVFYFESFNQRKTISMSESPALLRTARSGLHWQKLILAIIIYISFIVCHSNQEEN